MSDEQDNALSPEQLEELSDEALASYLENQYFEADSQEYWRNQAKSVKQFLRGHREAQAASEVEKGKNYYYDFWQKKRHRKSD